MTEQDIARARDQYDAEVKARWGGTPAYQASLAHRRTDREELAAAQGAGAIFKEFAAIRNTDPAGPAARALVARWQAYISDHYYPCSDDILSGLGDMYVSDERFTRTLDGFGQGTAQFMSRAIRAQCGG